MPPLIDDEVRTVSSYTVREARWLDSVRAACEMEDQYSKVKRLGSFLVSAC